MGGNKKSGLDIPESYQNRQDLINASTPALLLDPLRSVQTITRSAANKPISMNW